MEKTVTDKDTRDYDNAFLIKITHLKSGEILLATNMFDEHSSVETIRTAQRHVVVVLEALAQQLKKTIEADDKVNFLLKKVD